MTAVKYIASFLLCLLVELTTMAQRLAIDTTDRRVEYYRKLIREYNNIIQFIQQTLRQKSLPKSLCNVALIESGLDNKSLSTAMAAGTWQLMPASATAYGMQVSGKIDERYDLYKSTFVATQYLRNLYAVYHDCNLVVAAYNCGQGNVDKAIQKAGSNNYHQLAAYLPKETQQHVKKFWLACYAANEWQYIPQQSIDTIPDAGYKAGTLQTKINAGYKINVIARYLNIPEQELISLNPCIEEALAKNGTAFLSLPADKMPEFLLQQTEILTDSIN